MKTPNILLITYLLLFVVAISCGEGPNAESPVKTNAASGSLSYSPVSTGAAITTGYSFDGTEGDPIALGIASQWAANYREKNPGDTEAHFFGAAIIKQILAEPGCVGIRMYYTIDDKGQKQIVLVGVNAKGSDLLPSSSQLDASDPYVVVDFSWPCPSYCGNGL
jgi:hypothetical protein